MIIMSDRIPKNSELVDKIEAQGKTTDSISQRLVNLEELINKQESKNDNIIYAVLVAPVLILVTVATEVILSNRKDAQFYSSLEKDIYEQSLKIQDLSNKVDNVRVRNPYLK